MADNSELPSLDSKELRGRGRFVVILGASGTGKTTTLRDIYEQIYSSDHLVLACPGSIPAAQAFLEYLPRDAVVIKDVQKTIRAWLHQGTMKKILLLDDFLPVCSSPDCQQGVVGKRFLDILIVNACLYNLSILLTLSCFAQLCQYQRPCVSHTILLPKMCEPLQSLVTCHDAVNTLCIPDAVLNFVVKPFESVIVRGEDHVCFLHTIGSCSWLKPAK